MNGWPFFAWKLFQEMFANAIEESYQESLTRKQARASKGNQKAYAGIKWSHYHSF